MEKMIIFEPEFLGEKVPEGFNGVCISLDASLKSDLDWKEPVSAAKKYIEEGNIILWDLDFGIGHGLLHPLSHEGQFQSLKLAQEHFIEDILPHFVDKTIGAILYRGSLAISDEMKDFVELLAGYLPDEVLPYLFLDAREYQDICVLAQLISKVKTPSWQIALRATAVQSPGLVWGEGASSCGFIGRDLAFWEKRKAPNLGVCIPSVVDAESASFFLRALQELEKRNASYRIIAEEYLTIDWEGLDEILTLKKKLSKEGMRKINGFKAAGGEVVDDL